VHSGKTTKQASNTVLRMVVFVLPSADLQGAIARMASIACEASERLGAPLLRPSSVAYTCVQALFGALLPPLKIVGTRTALCLCEALGRDWV
jgi:hypothetical protein